MAPDPPCTADAPSGCTKQPQHARRTASIWPCTARGCLPPAKGMSLDEAVPLAGRGSIKLKFPRNMCKLLLLPRACSCARNVGRTVGGIRGPCKTRSACLQRPVHALGHPVGACLRAHKDRTQERRGGSRLGRTRASQSVAVAREKAQGKGGVGRRSRARGKGVRGRAGGSVSRRDAKADLEQPVARHVLSRCC
eukprot:1017300-Pleurochrysis_carterae.AAC.1